MLRSDLDLRPNALPVDTLRSGSTLTSALARESNIHRIKEQGGIVTVELHGEKQQPIGKPIPARIKAQIAAPRCVALYTSNPERGHKGGRRDAPRLSAASSPASDAFQPLPKAATNANHQPTRTPQTPSPTLHPPPGPPQPKGNSPPTAAPAQAAAGATRASFGWMLVGERKGAS